MKSALKDPEEKVNHVQEQSSATVFSLQSTEILLQIRVQENISMTLIGHHRQNSEEMLPLSRSVSRTKRN